MKKDKSIIFQAITTLILGALIAVSSVSFKLVSPAFAEGKGKELVNRKRVDKARLFIQSGNFNRAQTIADEILQSEPKKRQTQFLAWKILGNAHSGMGNYLEAIFAYEQSLKLQQSLSTLNNLVKSAIAKRASSSADNSNKPFGSLDLQRYATKAVEMADSDESLSAIYAYSNWVKLGQYLNEQQRTHSRQILNHSRPSRFLTYALINWSRIDRQDKQLYWLKQAEQSASSSSDTLAQSYVMLEFAHHFTKANNLVKAQEYLTRVRDLAQIYSYYEVSYRADYLLGRLFLSQGDSIDGLEAFKRAIAALELIDKDLYASSSSSQIAKYKQDSSIVYKKAIQLLLEQDKVAEPELKEVLDIASRLRVSELQSFFGDDCLELVDELEENKSTAVISSVILQDKTFIILQLPNGSLTHRKVNISSNVLKSLVIDWRKNLMQQENRNFSDNARILYDLLIKPVESDLINADIQTIKFIHDGVLRNIPMAALYDGEKYLVQKWASVSSIGLVPSKLVKPQKLTALIFALSEPIQKGWSQLQGVKTEVESVQGLLDSDRYINDNFTSSNFIKQLQSETFYNIVHIASHGKFGSNVDNSFILTYDDRLSIADLENSFRNQTSIELLVLSACETAVASDLSLLGLAGVAARSGVKTTLGSLWQVEDEDQSQSIFLFYNYWLNDNYTKAQALQRIQVKYIEEFTHPYKWASLNLIGESE